MRTFQNLLFVVIILLGCASCDKKPQSFSDVKSAMDACNQHLAELKTTKDVSIKKALSLYKETKELQDSAMAAFARDTNVVINDAIINDFFIVCDSMNTCMKSIVLTDDRTIDDAIYFKVNMSAKKNKIRKSELFEETSEFYTKLNDVPLYGTPQETINQYLHLLNYTKNNEIKNEKQFYNFIADEDKCFRSLLKYLDKIDNDNVSKILEWTEDILVNVENTFSKTKIRSKINMYVAMRFNRRIIQNAEVVEQQIKSKTKLSEQQMMEYKWMLLQPFISIDSELMAYITKDQEKVISNIGENLETYLTYLNGDRWNNMDKETKQYLTKIIVAYIINSCLI